MDLLWLLWWGGLLNCGGLSMCLEAGCLNTGSEAKEIGCKVQERRGTREMGPRRYRHL